MTRATTTEQPQGLIDAKEVARLYGIHEIVVWRWVKKKLIPAPVVQRHRYTRWDRGEVLDHIAGMRTAELQEAAS